MNTFNADHFIKKFSAIPETAWIEGELGEPGVRACALGHCCVTSDRGRYQHNEESRALVQLFIDFGLDVVCCNDGEYEEFGQAKRSPRVRVLERLEDMKKDGL